MMYIINVNFQSAGSTGFVAHVPKKLKTSGIEQLHMFAFQQAFVDFRFNCPMVL